MAIADRVSSTRPDRLGSLADDTGRQVSNVDDACAAASSYHLSDRCDGDLLVAFVEMADLYFRPSPPGVFNQPSDASSCTYTSRLVFENSLLVWNVLVFALPLAATIFLRTPVL